MNSFTFYSNYYELLDNLQKEDKLIMLEAIVDYMFKDIEPELEGLNKAIWVNIKMPLDTSKNNSLRSVGNGAPKGNKNASKTNQKQTKNKPKTNRKQTNNISTFLFLISNNNIINNININNYLEEKKILKEKIEEWLEYKDQKKDKYVERGLKQLLTTVINNTDKYGEDIVMALIDEAMANNWKGIVWERADKIKVIEKQLEKKTNDLDEYE